MKKKCNGSVELIEEKASVRASARIHFLFVSKSQSLRIAYTINHTNEMNISVLHVYFVIYACYLMRII